MIVAHLSDLHLGHRPYGPPGGGPGVRERDVARAFRSALRALLRIRPSLVLIAGDVFDRADPPPAAVVVFARGLETLRSALPETPVLIVAGARDTPGSAGDPGMLAAFDTLPNVEVATGTARSVRIERLGAHALLLPHRVTAGTPLPEVAPAPDARWNLLVAYGRASVAPAEDAGVSAPSDDAALPIEASSWDYIALGSEHAFRRITPRVVSAGSLERVGPEPWIEAHGTKGFVVADLDGGDAVLREVSGRPVVSLAPIRWDDRRPERVNERIRELSREVPGGVDGKIVRLRMEGMGEKELQELDSELLAELRRRTAHLSVDVGPKGPRTPARPVDPLALVVEQIEATGTEGEALAEAAARVLDAVDAASDTDGSATR